jgi:hypothetical protein
VGYPYRLDEITTNGAILAGEELGWEIGQAGLAKAAELARDLPGED